MDTSALISCAIFFTVFICWRIVDSLRKTIFREDFYRKIGWIAEQQNNLRCYNNRVGLRREELLSYIIKEQHNMNMPKDFCLDYSNENEKANAKEILNAHRNYVIRLYFSDDLILSKKKYNLKSLEYYMYSLHCFLGEEIKEHRDHEGKIYSYESSNRPYTHYSLTDYGRTYYKIYLTTLLFIENNEKTLRLFELIDKNHKNHIMEHLETNKVSFVRFYQ